MAASPVDAISKAVERSKQLLFPFKAEKWFALGFTVFMAQCGEAREGGSFNVPSGFPSGPSGTGGGLGGGSPAAEVQQLIEEAIRALQADLSLYVALAVAGALLVLATALFVNWFSSRAKLMFVESVVWDRVDVSAQWSRAAELGMSLFKFRLALGLIGGILGLSAVAAAVVAGLPDFRAGELLGTRALIAYAIFAGSSLFIGLPLAVTSWLLEDFVVPLMVVRNLHVLDAWRACRAEVIPGNVGGIIVFYLLRFVLRFATLIIISIIGCVTCCIVYIPYIGTVMLLPIWVFDRAYSLYYLEQLGIPIFPAPEPAWVAYDQWRFPR
jgi:hypothetical protein